MKQILLRIAVLIITFTLGATFNWILSEKKVAQNLPSPSVELVTLRVVDTSATLAPPAKAPVVAPSTKLILDYDSEKFFPDGDYFILGNHPKEFSEFQSFAFWSSNIEATSGGLEVFLQTDRAAGISHDAKSAIFALVTERHICFVVPEGNEGYGYRFDGEFLRRDIHGIESENTPVIRGTLTKTRNGRRVVERVVTFGIQVHGC